MSEDGQRGSLVYLTRLVLVATLGGLLFGYDTAVISGAIGFLQTHFGLSATLKGWAASCALVGCMLGAMLAGPVSDRFGRRTTLILSAVLFLISAIGTAVPRTLGTFVIYRIIGGMGVGAASMTSPMYIAEISPARLRGRMVSINQFAIVTGILVVYFVNYFIAAYGQTVDLAAGLVVKDGEVSTEAWNVVTGWRYMFASEALPAAMLLVLVLFVPESPRWLTKQGRARDAHRILTRIDGSDHADRETAEIRDALSHESASLRQLIAPGVRWAMVIGVSLAILQQVTGINVFLYYAPEIFKGIGGSGVDAAMFQTVVVGAVNLGFTVLAIWLVDKIGRKPLMLIGAAGMGLSLTAIGVAAWRDQLAAWVLVFMLGYIACFALSVGPVTWVVLSEIFPTKIRGRAMGVATVCLWAANTIVSQTFPMMDENPWLIETFNHGFPFFVYAAFCVVLVVFMIYAVPETRGQTLEQIEQRWMRS